MREVPVSPFVVSKRRGGHIFLPKEIAKQFSKERLYYRKRIGKANEKFNDDE